MDLKQSAKESAKVLSSYLTFQAVKTVLDQLKETNPARAYWLNAFSTKEALQDGEAYLSALLEESADLAIRVMTVRQHIAHRRQHLERITQLGDAEHTVDSDFAKDTHVPQESTADADPSPE